MRSLQAYVSSQSMKQHQVNNGRASSHLCSATNSVDTLPTDLADFLGLTHVRMSNPIGLSLPKVSVACLLAVSAVALVLAGPCDSPVISPSTNTTIRQEETAWQCLKCAPSQSNVVENIENHPSSGSHRTTSVDPRYCPEASLDFRTQSWKHTSIFVSIANVPPCRDENIGTSNKRRRIASFTASACGPHVEGITSWSAGCAETKHVSHISRISRMCTLTPLVHCSSDPSKRCCMKTSSTALQVTPT